MSLSPLQLFLLEKPVESVTEEVILSAERLKGFKFKVKPVGGKEYNAYQKLCVENPNSPKKRNFNATKFSEMIIVNHCLEPNFKDPEWLAQAKVVSPTDLLYKTLLSGEIQELADTVLTLSGFNNDAAESLEEEVKNSSTEETETPGTVSTQ